MSLDYGRALQTAERIAREAGALLRAGFDQPREIQFKAETDLVTQFDRQSEALIVGALHSAYPEHGIVGEEGGGTAPDRPADYIWYIDPIDGTTNFAHHIPHYAVSIGLAGADGWPVLGVVYDPAVDECFTAAKEFGAALNGRPIHVSGVLTLERALVQTGFPYEVWTNPDNNAAQWAAMLVRCQATRCMGSAALDLAYVAAGRIDGYWEPALKPWDLMAGAIIVEEAGGRISNYRGQPDGVLQGRYFVASNGLIHDLMLELLSMGVEVPRPGLS